MPITDRNLPAGTTLVARYKGQTYRCTVLEHEGKLAFSLEDNSIHPSPSAAASKVMGGVSANGWRFWSREGDIAEKADRPHPAVTTKQASLATKLVRVIKKLPNQKGVPEGSTKFWCSACMRGFTVEGLATPDACPEGHAKEQTDELATPATQVAAAQ